MLIAEYDYKTDIKVKQQEAFEDGIAQGVAQQKAKDEKLLKQTVAQKDAEVARQAAEIMNQAKRIAELEALLKSKRSQIIF